MRDVGDVRELQGKNVQISGHVQHWRSGAEIVLRDARQLRGEAGRLPPMPRNFDVERRGNFSAGKFGHGTTAHTPAKSSARKKPDTTDVDVIEQDARE